VLQSGDLVQNGEVQALWDDEFWPTVLPLARETPMYPALGNHERKGAPYFKYFDVPEEYSFDYGNAHFVALNSNRPPSEHHAQEEWLRKDLAAHKSATWRIVFFHHTPYTCVAIENRRVSSVALRNRLEPIFKAGNVQLVVNGHDHNYQHHLANGIHYLVTGGGGAPLYDLRMDTPFTKTAKKAHHHCEITVNGTSMNVRAIEPDGTVIEQFVVITTQTAVAERVNTSAQR
jgi:3',5'-cyclic AMP phosphodiesterase CpdA